MLCCGRSHPGSQHVRQRVPCLKCASPPFISDLSIGCVLRPELVVLKAETESFRCQEIAYKSLFKYISIVSHQSHSWDACDWCERELMQLNRLSHSISWLRKESVSVTLMYTIKYIKYSFIDNSLENVCTTYTVVARAHMQLLSTFMYLLFHFFY